MSLDPAQFRHYIIDPTLRQIALYSAAASNLLLGTALQESGLVYLHQLGGGPALGLYQCEPATLDDIIQNYLPFHPEIFSRILDLKGTGLPASPALVCNLAYATAICRVHYLRDPAPLPDAADAYGMAMLYKRVYNTPAGAATVEGARVHFQAAIDTPQTMGT
jgi:hypothetical protein